MSDTWGGYGTGFDESALAQLLPFIVGSLSDQKGVLDVQQKGANNIQDLIKLLLDPQFAMLTGTYDPMLSVDTQEQQQQGLMLPTPLLDAAARSGDPTVQRVASMIKSGEIADPMVAFKTLADAASNDPSSALGGMSADQIRSTVDDWFGELSDQQITLAKTQYDASSGGGGGSSKPKDMWAEAGLPNPMEQYYANFDAETGMLDTNAPLSQGVSSSIEMSRDRMGRMQQAYKDFLTANPEYRDPRTRRTNADQVEPLSEAASSAAARVSTDQKGLTLEDLPKFLRDNGLNDGKKRIPAYDEAKLRQIAQQNGGIVPWEVLKDNTENGAMTEWGRRTPAVWDTVRRRLDDWKTSFVGERMAQDKTAAEWSGRGALEAKRNSASGAQDSFGDRKWVDLQNAMLGNQFASGRAVGETLLMQAQGRTPTQDNLQRRLAMLRAAGLF